MADLVEARADPADRDVGQGADRVGPVVPAAHRQDRNRKSRCSKSENKRFAQ